MQRLDDGRLVLNTETKSFRVTVKIEGKRRGRGETLCPLKAEL